MMEIRRQVFPVVMLSNLKILGINRDEQFDV